MKQQNANHKPIRIMLLFGFTLVAIAIVFFYSTNNHSKSGKEEPFNERVVSTFKPESGTAFKYASPLLYDEHIYIGTSERTGYEDAPISGLNDNFFYKLDLDLNVAWQYPLHKKIVSGGAVMDSQQNLYFVTDLLNDKNNANKKDRIFTTTYLTSLTEDGELRWERQISDGEELWDHNVLTPAVSTDDIMYIGNHRFFAFDTEGNLLAQYPTEENMKIANYGGAPVIDQAGYIYFTSPHPIDFSDNNKISKEGKVIVPSTDEVMAYKFEPRLASLIWSTQMGNEVLDNEGGNSTGGGHKTDSIESSPALGIGDRSLFGITGCTISKIDTATGQLLWSLKPDGATGHFTASPVIDDTDNLYVGTKSNNESRFYAISSSGKQLWRTDIGSDLYNSPVLTDDNMIYVGSETNVNGKFYALDRNTGTVQWSIFKDQERKIPDFSVGSMLVYQGYAYVGVHTTGENESDPAFYKIRIDADGYLANAAWPRIFGGNSNLGRRD